MLITVGSVPTFVGRVSVGDSIVNNGQDPVYLGMDPNTVASAPNAGTPLYPYSALQWNVNGRLWARCPAASNPTIEITNQGSVPYTSPFAAGEQIVGTGLQSGNYVPGVSGWRIAKDGTVEFGAGTFRGDVISRDATTGREVDIISSGASAGRVVIKMNTPGENVGGIFASANDLGAGGFSTILTVLGIRPAIEDVGSFDASLTLEENVLGTTFSKSTLRADTVNIEGGRVNLVTGTGAAGGAVIGSGPPVHGMDWGTNTQTSAAGTAQITQGHSMGIVPQFVMVQSAFNGTAHFTEVDSSGWTSTQFVFRIRTDTGALAVSQSFVYMWMAIA